MSATVESSQTKTKNVILSILTVFGHRQSPALRKSQLIDEVMELKSSFDNGAVLLVTSTTQDFTPAQQRETKKRKLL